MVATPRAGGTDAADQVGVGFRHGGVLQKGPGLDRFAAQMAFDLPGEGRRGGVAPRGLGSWECRPEGTPEVLTSGSQRGYEEGGRGERTEAERCARLSRLRSAQACSSIR
jgi:hypothetical protein